MTWLKIFSAVFAAALLAGLAVFGIHRHDVQMDRDAAEWDVHAGNYVKMLSDWRAMSDQLPSLDKYEDSIKAAEDLLKQAPKRAHTFKLENEISYSKETVTARKAQLAK